MFIDKVKTAIQFSIKVRQSEVDASETWRETLEYQLRKRFGKDADVVTRWKQTMEGPRADGGTLTVRLSFGDEFIQGDYDKCIQDVAQMLQVGGVQLVISFPENNKPEVGQPDVVPEGVQLTDEAVHKIDELFKSGTAAATPDTSNTATGS